MASDDTLSIRSALAAGMGRLRAQRLDVEVLLAFVLGRPRSYLHAWPEHPLDARQQAHFLQCIDRRAAGEPVAYLTGRREFWSMEILVTPATLIPRPETELLVQEALVRIPASAGARIADLGTGSGAVALAIASERRACRIIGVDISAAALEVARTNAVRYNLDNVEFRMGDWHTPLTGEACDMIVSNPPYIPEDDVHLQQGDVRFEPRPALTAGTDGLDAIRHLVQHAPDVLAPGGWLLLEHGYDQQEAVLNLLQQHGYHNRFSCRDFAGQPRIAGGQWGVEQ